MSDTLRERLADVYGLADSAELLDAQVARYQEAIQAFRVAYGGEPAAIFRAPGRVNLIGEHTDYNQGYVLPMALDRDILLLARPRRDGEVVLRDLEAERFTPRQFTISTEIPPAPRGDWENYIKGVAQTICQRFALTPPLSHGEREAAPLTPALSRGEREATPLSHAMGEGPGVRAMRGMDALVAGRQPWGVPMRAGLSSSSALCVVAAVALLDLNGWTMPLPELAHLCSEAEWYVGTRGGMMDQFISLMGRRGHALFLDCRPDESVPGRFRTDWVPIPAGHAFLVCDSGMRRENTRSAFNARVAECKIGVQLLLRRYAGISHLRDISAGALGITREALDQILSQELPIEADIVALMRLGVPATFLDEVLRYHSLPADLSFVVQARCRHVIDENQRVLDSVDALKRGQAGRLGELMNQAHASMSRDYAASCAQLDLLVGLLQGSPGVLGARVTGAGWGGCAVALIEAGADAGLAERIGPAYRAQTGKELRLFVCRPSAGAGRITDGAA